MKRLIGIFMITLFHAGCTETEINSDSFSQLVEHKAQEKEIYNFMIPDSINTRLIATAYYRWQPKAHAFIVYSDSLRNSASLIEYFTDGRVNTEALQVTKYNEFRSTSGNKDLVITPAKVKIFTQSAAGSMYVQEEIRIDIPPPDHGQ